MARRARSRQDAAPEPGAKAILLLSGGLDSCAAGAAAKAEGYELHAVSFDYGQRHRKELLAAKKVGEALGAKSHRVLKVPLGDLGGSALTDAAIAVPDAPEPGKIGERIPSTYVPARNTVFLSLALAVAEVEDARAIVIGANALDYSGYPDCRPEFLEAFERMANLATKAGTENRTVKVLAPLLHLSKRDIVLLAARLKAPIALTWSCYRGGVKPCGACESCVLRAQGFAAAGIADPAVA
ncbi:MAG TPA: 7-cyano-7-deazaguanine synthase QueC [Candidatus Thermoplasmatota archaeon]|nr:7-cyano-7-deazaguanine synthase QueC [Candidatus Thermoplasmatota archaeon]